MLQTETVEEDAKPKNPYPGLKVLLVDDDEDDFLLTRDCISKIRTSYYQLDWVDNYEKALSVMDEDDHDIYLVDYSIGAHTGFDLLLAAQDMALRKPLILLTGVGNMEIDKEAIRLGAADYLPKMEMSVTGLERALRHAMERSRLINKLRHQAIHDDLTAIFNRRYILQRLEALIASASRHHFHLSFALCDIDNFKHINDSYGHQMGDKVIIRFAQLINETIRREDIPGRYGGDEFAVIFSHSGSYDSSTCAERIRQKLAAELFTNQQGRTFQVTATFGIAEHHHGMTSDQLIAKADKALYSAKEQGRNRTFLDP